MAYSVPPRERRVLKAGHSSIAVTLPKPWAEAMNLHPGDLVVFDQNDDGTLYLKPAPAAGESAIGAPFVVQARSFGTPGVLTRLVVGAYRVGHEAVEIRTEAPFAPERLEELHAAARSLLGVSIVAQEPTRVVLQNFIDPSKYGLPQLVQRTRMILVALLDEADEMFERRGRSRRLASLSDETNKVLALLVRQLFLASRDWTLARRIGSSDPRQMLEWRVVVQALEELGHGLIETVQALDAEPARARRADRSARALVQELRNQLRISMEALMHPALGAACEALGESIRLRNAVGDRLRAPVRRRSGRPLPLPLERCSALLETLSAVALDRAVSAGSEAVLLEAA